MKKIILTVLLFLEFINYYDIKTINKELEIMFPNRIIISKIGLDQNFYSYESYSVDTNIIYLKSTNFDNNFVILASHSGNSDISYFKNINKLVKGDEIVLFVNNKKIKYELEEIKYIKKDGKIRLSDEENKDILYLTTCDKHNNKRQLLVKCVKKV